MNASRSYQFPDTTRAEHERRAKLPAVRVHQLLDPRRTSLPTLRVLLSIWLLRRIKVDRFAARPIPRYRSKFDAVLMPRVHPPFRPQPRNDISPISARCFALEYGLDVLPTICALWDASRLFGTIIFRGIIVEGECVANFLYSLVALYFFI